MDSNKFAGLMPQLRAAFDARDKAMSGDIVLSILPSTVSTAATAAAWSRTVTMRLQTAAGELHDWYNGTQSGSASIADASNAGTATIPNTNLVFVDGVASKVVSGDAAAWLGGTAQVETATVAMGVKQVETAVCTTGAATKLGTITVTVTAAGMPNSPKAIEVEVGNGDNTTVVGGLVRAALAADTDVAGFFTVTGGTTTTILTSKTKAANDITMAVAVVDTDGTGVVFSESTNTTAGVAPVITTAGNATVVVTDAGVATQTISVALALNDTPTAVATKIATALNANSVTGARWTAVGVGETVVLTRKNTTLGGKYGGDGTFNVALADGTCVGVLTAASSASTTSGVASETDTLTIGNLTVLGVTVTGGTSVETFI